MKFTKMHGCGNDYVYVDGFADPVPADPAEVARLVSPRQTGIGSDGLILLLPPEHASTAHAKMRMFNADGSESEMCGNGIRCICKLAFDRGHVDVNPMLIETGAGLLSLAYTLDENGLVDQVTVDMGEPITQLSDVPVDESQLDDETRQATYVSMGNPHAVVFVDAVEPDVHLATGQRLEHHAAYPARMNLHFVEQIADDEVRVLHWERGSGPTLACGTGACAVAVAGVLTGRTPRRVTTHLPGGDLTIHWNEQTNHVEMTGPAVEVFTGDWHVDVPMIAPATTAG